MTPSGLKMKPLGWRRDGDGHDSFRLYDRN
jgi:hypothetical protein